KDLESDEIILENELYRQVFAIAKNEVENGNSPGEMFYLHHEDRSISGLATDLLSQKHELANWEKVKVKVKTEEDKLKFAVTQAILSLKLRVLETKFEKTQKLMHIETDEENLMVLMVNQQKIKKKISLVSKELGRIILR
ncbi:MAG: hypothetical protein IH598_11815, partial [Bacteroidales bacterium]|nr:hypothetical protein [Bacteroidales bacterium]